VERNSAPPEQPPSRRDEWIRQALDDSNGPQEQRSRDPNDDHGAREPDEAAGENIGRVVGADKDAPGSDGGRCGEEEDSYDTVEEEDGESDTERCARMVAGKRRVVGAGNPDVRGRMRLERTLASPSLGDQLVDEQSERAGGEGAGRGELPVTIRARPSEEPEPKRGDGDDEGRHRFHVGERPPEPRVVQHEQVDRVVDAVVQGAEGTGGACRGG
jgi:hypothetical protein